MTVEAALGANMKRLFCIAAALVITGCAPSQAIKDLEEDKVIVAETSDVQSRIEEIDRLAQEGCALHGRQAIPISTTTDYYGRREHLFACVPLPGGGSTSD